MHNLKNHLKKSFITFVALLSILGTNIVNVTPIYANNIVTKDCGDGWVEGEGGTCTIGDDESKDSPEYTNFKNEIKNNISYLPATAIIKASGDIDFSSYNVKNVVKGPDGYYLVEFNTMADISSKMKQLSSQSGVEYAEQNYGTVDKAMLESNDFESTFKKYVESLIEIKNQANATRPSDEKLKELAESDGQKVKFKSFEAFYEQTNGKSYDLDGAFGAQCVDGARYYIGWLGYDNSSRGNAVDYWANRYTNGMLENFLEIDAGDTLQNGDILVFGPTSGNSYGHISIYHNGFSYGQNQGTDGNGGPFNELFSYTSVPNFLGAFRPKCYRNGSEGYKVRVNLEKDKVESEAS